MIGIFVLIIGIIVFISNVAVIPYKHPITNDGDWILAENCMNSDSDNINQCVEKQRGVQKVGYVTLWEWIGLKKEASIRNNLNQKVSR